MIITLPITTLSSLINSFDQYVQVKVQKSFKEKRSSHYEFCILDLPQSVEWGFDGLVLNGKT